VSSCSQSFSAEALLRSVNEMVERIAELHDLRRRVRKAEERARAGRWHTSSDLATSKRVLFEERRHPIVHLRRGVGVL
jgi:hypothetical protein